MGSGAPAKAGRNACRKRNVTYLPGGPGKRRKILALPCHAADWARGRVDNSDDCAAKQKAQAPSWFAGIRFVVISPARLSSRFCLSCFALGPWPGRFHCVSGKTSPAARVWFSPSLRSKLPYGPKLRTSSCHAAAAAQRAASLRLGLGTDPLRVPSVPRPRSGPSALLRTP